MIRLCIVVPMYNEQGVAVNNLVTIINYVRKLPCETAVLVVDDGSTDRTNEFVLELVREQKDKLLCLISHECNKGYGAANRTGGQYAIAHGYEYVLFMDSDLTNHPKFLKDFYAKMTEGWDYIKASRYMKGGEVVGVSWKRRLVSIAGNTLARLAYRIPLTDFTNGYRAIRTRLFSKIKLNENGFAIILEELTKAKHWTCSFCEIPYVLTVRQKGQGATHFSYNLVTYWRYLKFLIQAFFTCRKRA